MRVESKRPTKNHGYLHFLDEPRPQMTAPPQPTEITATRDWGALSYVYRAGIRAVPIMLDQLADKWGLATTCALDHLNVGWLSEARAYTFPMSIGMSRITGIHLRYIDGRKLCMRGSKMGLFVPENFGQNASEPLYICEGASDAAVLLDRGLPAIGRPSNIGLVDSIVDFCMVHSVKEVVLITDRDKPGSTAAACTERGRRTLVASLRAIRCRVKCIRPPGHNDVREWAPSRETIEAVTEAAKWMR
tara:strand:+ start:103 stop:840 length:738 start_codon:yes stop_codon:yes gene_type:complete